MKNLKIIFITLLLALLTVSFKQDKPKILIIGDSISIGYTPFVTENLKDLAEVYHNPGNAQHTGKGLKNVEEWITDRDYDIIQFNWGLWDLCYRHENSNVQGKRDKVNGTITFRPEEYEKQLRAIVKILKEKSNAKLIFVTTSYVPKNEAGRFTKDPLKYNKIAKKIMKENGISVNDTYKATKRIHAKLGKGDDDVHYMPEGYKSLGELITAFLENDLHLVNY